ncbi:Transcriptional regulator [hydrothermal vent metagenome]|uniref:Transcriptional regulator n=1 Tax=hydrothermal vent metagenome TaxID=652676 RepID=A0A3B0USD5_9ZZZZ
MKSIIIVDRHYLIQAGIEALIQEIPGLTLLKTHLGDEPRLTSILLKHKPDLLIIDPFSLSPENATLPRKIRSSQNTLIIALIQKEDKNKLSSDYDEVLFYEESKLALEKKLRHQAGNLQSNEATPKELSQREITILKLIVKGLTHQEVADKLFLSIHTVNTHRKNINRKLGIKTVSGLSVYAIMNHLIQMEELVDKR